MGDLQLLILAQFGAILYLIYRVHRLEQRLSGGKPVVRRVQRPQGEGKVVPLLKDGLPPGPFAKGNRSAQRTDNDQKE